MLNWLVGTYLRAALATTRWTIDGEDHLAPFVAQRPVVAAFWHECLPLLPALAMAVKRRNPTRRLVVLISRHRDGRFIAGIVGRFGIGTVHGSSAKAGRDKGGAAGMRALLAALAGDAAVVITPDGPRGPRRVAAPGVTQIAAMAGVLVLPCAARTTHRVTLKSWDRMILPLPFGRGVIVCAPAIDMEGGAEAALARVTVALTDAAERARMLCGLAPET